jgi:ribosomal protein S1
MTDHFADLLEEYEHQQPKMGQIVQGTILEIDDNAVILDIGAHRDAIVPGKELEQLDEKTRAELTIGSKVPVYVSGKSEYEDELVVSIEKGLELQDWERAREAMENETLLELEVTGHNKGGLLVAFGRITGFVPNSHIPGLQRWYSHEQLGAIKTSKIGEKLVARVLEIDRDRQRFVLSAQAGEEKRRENRLKELEVGERVSGIVSNVVQFGAFVDLGGVDGLIHVSNLAWDQSRKPSEILQVGEQVEVLIEKVDLERERVSLNRKALLPNPWEKFAEKYKVGDLVEGIVANVHDYGAFVQLTPEISGLVHVSEILLAGANSPSDLVRTDDKLLVQILEIDTEEERISLSMRQVPYDDYEAWMQEDNNKYEVQLEDKPVPAEEPA